MSVEASHHRGLIRHDGIELLARRQTTGKRSVAPAATADPVSVGVSCGKLPNPVLHGRERLHALEVDVVQFQAAAEDVRVNVVESRHHGGAVRVNHLSGGAAKPADVVVGANGHDVIAAYREGLLKRLTVG